DDLLKIRTNMQKFIKYQRTLQAVKQNRQMNRNGRNDWIC
ncbi:hypothetical protein AAULR_13367, partial [Lacticaseibacillus rhamnosus MTCC 5462]